MDISVQHNQTFQISTHGLARIENLVSGLENEFEQGEAIKSGLRAMGGVFMRGGKSRLGNRLLHHGSKGNLMSSFKIKTKRHNKGVLIGFGKLGHHSHLVDSGTKKRYTKSGAYRGIMPANYFWHETAEADFPQAAEQMFEGIEKAVTRRLYQ